MTDENIVELFFRRQETAIEETQKKYHAYLYKIAYNVLRDAEDCLESENDTYLHAWNSIPPHRPQQLSTYLGKIIRRVSIDMLRKKTRAKRGGTEYDISINELEECISMGDDTETRIELKMMGKLISDYLRTLSPENRNVFVGRYFYMDSLKEVAAYYNMSEPKVKSMLYRIRQGLKDYLEKEGFAV